MPRFLIALALLAASLCAPISAQTINVQHDGVPAFCATSLSPIVGSTWNFVGTCSTPPPFNPPNDPNAMASILGRFQSHACGTFATNNAQDFSSVFGQLEGGNIIIGVWPFRPQTSVAFQIPGNRYYGGVIQMPANPGTVRHGLHGDPYGGSCGLVATRVRSDWRVVGVGAQPTPTGVCSGTYYPDGTTFVTFNPSASAATDNRALCNLRPMGAYRVILDPQGTANATVLLTYY